MSEIGGTLIAAIVDLSRVAFGGARFLFSASYRKATRERWNGHPVQRAIEIITGTISLLALVAVITWVVLAFTRPEKKKPERFAEELKQRVVEKVRDGIRDLHKDRQ